MVSPAFGMCCIQRARHLPGDSHCGRYLVGQRGDSPHDSGKRRRKHVGSPQFAESCIPAEVTGNSFFQDQCAGCILRGSMRLRRPVFGYWSYYPAGGARRNGINAVTWQACNQIGRGKVKPRFTQTKGPHKNNVTLTAQTHVALGTRASRVRTFRDAAELDSNVAYIALMRRASDLVSESLGHCVGGQLGSDSPFSASTFAKATADKKTAEKRCQTPNATRRSNQCKRHWSETLRHVDGFKVNFARRLN